MDNLDKKILNQLQIDNTLTNAGLAESVGLSPPACLKRVARLRSTGIIESEVAILDPKRVGHKINVIVEIEFERDRPDLYRHFLDLVSAASEVSQCYQVTGEVDMILVVSVPDMDAYDGFVHRVLYAEPNLKKFKTLISLRREKFQTAIKL